LTSRWRRCGQHHQPCQGDLPTMKTVTHDDPQA
jgi:hypothetical protein